MQGRRCLRRMASSITVAVPIQAPQIWGGVRLSALGLGGNVCQQRAKYRFFNNNLNRNHNKGERLPVLRATQNWQTYLLRKIKLHMSFGLPGPLRTTFELKNSKPGVTKYARCGYTNVACRSLSEKANNIKICFRTLQKCIYVYLIYSLTFKV